MYFRYFEFLSPQETMIYKKKNIFNVEEDWIKNDILFN
jgi:hypothetical protein